MSLRQFSRLIALISVLSLFAAVSSKPTRFVSRKALEQGDNAKPATEIALRQLDIRKAAPIRRQGTAPSGARVAAIAAPAPATTVPTIAPTIAPPIIDLSITLEPTTTGVSLGINIPTQLSLRAVALPTGLNVAELGSLPSAALPIINVAAPTGLALSMAGDELPVAATSVLGGLGSAQPTLGFEEILFQDRRAGIDVSQLGPLPPAQLPAVDLAAPTGIALSIAGDKLLVVPTYVLGGLGARPTLAFEDILFQDHGAGFNIGGLGSLPSPALPTVDLAAPTSGAISIAGDNQPTVPTSALGGLGSAQPTLAFEGTFSAHAD